MTMTKIYRTQLNYDAYGERILKNIDTQINEDLAAHPDWTIAAVTSIEQMVLVVFVSTEETANTREISKEVADKVDWTLTSTWTQTKDMKEVVGESKEVTDKVDQTSTQLSFDFTPEPKKGAFGVLVSDEELMAWGEELKNRKAGR